MEKLKQFFAAPTYWQRLALLSLLSMFISHLILLSSRVQSAESKGEVDIFAVVAGAVILLFVVGWSALNGTSNPKFISRTIGVVCASFEIHRLGYSFIWPKKLDELGQPTFQVFAIVLIVGLLVQSLTGKTASDLALMIKEQTNKLNKIKLPKIMVQKGSTLTTKKEITENQAK